MSTSDLDKLARITYRMFEGDDVNEEYTQLLWELGYVDENGEWIYEEDE